MALADRTLGALLLCAAVGVFAYYTVWTIVLPFVDAGHPLQRLFPDAYYALAAPLVLLVAGLAVIGSLIAMVMIKAGTPKPKTS